MNPIALKRNLAWAAALTGALAGTPTRAHATNLNIPSLICRAVSDPSNDLRFTNVGVTNNSLTTHEVRCAVPRSPLADNATEAVFFVDGRNVGGSTTRCSLSSYNFNGQFLGSRVFSSTAATYDERVAFPAALVPTFAYVTASCFLPPGGTFLGVIVIQ